MNPSLMEAVRRLKAESEREIETDPRVMEMVREQLERDPPPSLAALYGRAVRLNREIRKLTPRQFNARYPLQVRKELKAARKANGDRRTRQTGQDGARTGADGGGPSEDRIRAVAERPAAGAGDVREAENGRRSDGSAGLELSERIRKVFLQYAKVVAAAQTTAELIQAFEQTDRYVEAVADLTQPGS